jgi:hypothetical protein
MGRPDWPRTTTLRKAIGTLGVAGWLAPVASEVRLKRPLRLLTDRWRSGPVAPTGTAWSPLPVASTPRLRLSGQEVAGILLG